MWTNIVLDLELPISHVNVHPDSNFEHFWEDRFLVRHDPSCVWTDGNVGGFCSELFTPGGVEFGKLVNPLGHSVDVAFGFERMLQVLESKPRIDDTELFNPVLDPVSRDHFRNPLMARNKRMALSNQCA